MVLHGFKTNPNRRCEPETRKNRVVHVCSIGTVPKWFLLEHFHIMQREGFEVTLICSDDESARYCAQAVGVRFIPITIKQRTAFFSDLIGLFRLWRLLRKLQPDIAHAHMSKAGLIGSLASWLARVPIRIYHNHAIPIFFRCWLGYWFLYLTELIACRCATRVIFVSASNMRDAIELGFCPKEKATVLGPGTICGIDVEKFNPRAAARRGAELRQKAGIPRESWIVGCVARIVPHKGIETIISAWRLLPEDVRSRAFLCFFGSYSSHFPRMQALVEQAVSEPGLNVKYIGFSNDMPRWYSTMTLLAQPSWREGWGYNVLEAACCGVPAVGTKISGTIDAILDGQTGLLVPVKDPEAMAKAIVKLLKNDDLRQRLGQAARERTINEFSQDKICPLLVQEYQRLLAS